MVSPTILANPVSLTWTQIPFRFFLKKGETISSSSEEHSFCLGLRLYHFLAVLTSLCLHFLCASTVCEIGIEENLPNVMQTKWDDVRLSLRTEARSMCSKNVSCYSGRELQCIEGKSGRTYTNFSVIFLRTAWFLALPSPHGWGASLFSMNKNRNCILWDWPHLSPVY